MAALIFLLAAWSLRLVVNKLPVIFLMGPTASGKTDMAIALSQHLPVDIISVDSALIYRGMDIGTAKPSQAELQQAPHALIDICDPSERYSAADFCHDALAEIEKSHANNRMPLLVGGTMMYFNALLNGLADMPATDEATRAQIESEANLKGWAALHAELEQVDPEAASQIHPNHSHRIARALAVYRMGGKTITEYRRQQAVQDESALSGLANNYDVRQLALLPSDRQWLHQRIEQRFMLMLEQGLVAEVKGLYQREDLQANIPSMRCVGYRQVWEYLEEKTTFDVMVQKGMAATRQLAKRQLTWLRGWDNLSSLDAVSQNNQLTTNFDKNLQKALNYLSFQSI